MTAPPSDLSRFQLHILAVCTAGSKSGQSIKDALRSLPTYDAFSHARVYHNVDDLVERGLLTKRATNGRENAHAITEAGRDVLAAERAFLASGARTVIR